MTDLFQDALNWGKKVGSEVGNTFNPLVNNPVMRGAQDAGRYFAGNVSSGLQGGLQGVNTLGKNVGAGIFQAGQDTGRNLTRTIGFDNRSGTEPSLRNNTSNYTMTRSEIGTATYPTRVNKTSQDFAGELGKNLIGGIEGAKEFTGNLFSGKYHQGQGEQTFARVVSPSTYESVSGIAAAKVAPVGIGYAAVNAIEPQIVPPSQIRTGQEQLYGNTHYGYVVRDPELGYTKGKYKAAPPKKTKTKSHKSKRKTSPKKSVKKEVFWGI